MWVLLRNQCVLLLPPPTFQLFFAGDCATDVAEMFEIDKICAVIRLSEPGDFPRPMLANAAFKIIGYPDIQRRPGLLLIM
jgi:hypothetical protein